MPGSPLWGSPQAGSPIRTVNQAIPHYLSPLVSSINVGQAVLGSPNTLKLTLNPSGVYTAPFGEQTNAGGTTTQLITNPMTEYATSSGETVGYPSF